MSLSSPFGWDYPPGVTGGELKIAGPDYERESDMPCPECGGTTTFECGYRDQRWLMCGDCDAQIDLPPIEPDPDRAHDEARERRLFGED